MSGPRSNSRGDAKRTDNLKGKPPSKRLLRYLESDVGQRTLFRPSKEPVHIKLPGRNDPCPCGSGKKFKRCHSRSPAASSKPSSG